jgi:hypothetical protein
MSRKKVDQDNLSKLIVKKIPFEDVPLKTIRVTFHALRWMFLLVFLLIAIGIFLLFLIGEGNFLQIILGYTIIGFFTFFMGYFGWILAQGMIGIMTGKKEKTDHSILYYFKHNKRHKF